MKRLLLLLAVISPIHGAPATGPGPKIGLPDTLPPGFDGTLPIANHHVDRSLNEIIFTWKLLKFPPAGGDGSAFTTAVGKVHLPDFQPRSRGPLKLDLPAIWKDADALRIMVNEFNGALITSRTWPLKERGELLHAPPPAASAPVPELVAGDLIRVRCGDLMFSFSPHTGQLERVTIKDRDTGLAGGPRPVSAGPGKPPASSAPPLAVSVESSGKLVSVHTGPATGPETFRWTVHPGGRLQLDYRFPRAGVSFALAPAKLKTKRWLGAGPDFGLWKMSADDDRFLAPCQDVVWITLTQPGSAITIIPESANTTVALTGPAPTAPADAENHEPSGGLFLSNGGTPTGLGDTVAGSVSFLFHHKHQAPPNSH